MAKGVAAFDPDREMIVEKPYEVRLAIGGVGETDAVVTRSGGSDQVAVTAIRIGARMRAELKGAGFDIELVDGDAERSISAANRETWVWRVTPKTKGPKKLSVMLRVLSSDGTEIDAYEGAPITVNVDISEEAKAEEERAQTEKDLAWYKKLLDLLKDFWWAAIGLLLAIIAGIRIVVKSPAKPIADKPAQD